MFQPVCGALDRLGRLWVTDHGASNVKVFLPSDLSTEGFDPNEDYLSMIGSKGTGNGQFNFNENSFAFPGIAIMLEGGQVQSGEVIATQTVSGVETEFSGTLLHVPVVESSVTFSATVSGTLVNDIVDDGLGVLTGTGATGTINYATGAWTLDFTTAPDINSDILAAYRYPTDVTAEVLEDSVVEGTLTFSGTLAHIPTVAEYDSITINATVSATPITIACDNATPVAALTASGVTGTLTWATGAWTLDFGATAPDTASTITIDYTYYTAVSDEEVDTQDVVGLETEFSGRLGYSNISPTTVSITCNVNGSLVTITDTADESGITGTLADVGQTVSGTIDYATGRWTLDFGSTPPDSEIDGSADITAGYTFYSDRVFVADTFNHRVQIFDIAGTYKGQFGSYGDGDGEFKFPAGLAVDSINYKLHVVDSGNNRVQILTPRVFWNSLTFTAEYGTFGHGIGNLYMPLGILFVDSTPDYVLIADSYNSRIVKFAIAVGGASVTTPDPENEAAYVMKSLTWDNGMLTGTTGTAGATGPAVFAPRSITSDGTNAIVTGHYVGNVQFWSLANWALYGHQELAKQTISEHERLLMLAPQAVVHQSAGEIVLEGHPVIVVNEDGTANETGFRVFSVGD